ncbi:MAG: metal-dependent hydrolase, partial [Acidobacteria bacterium]|nr:metal-dependent hydrolase [Acidobacteriota bacterium]
SDHMGDALALAKKYQPHIITIFEISLWLEGKGVGNLHPMGKGGTQTLEGVTVTMTQAHHSSSILDEGKMVYAGEPAGYVIQFSTGYRMYHAGDTALFGDMKLIGELYRPKLALLPIGDLFTMGPQEAAHAAKLLRVREVVPMHFGTFPLLTGTVEAFKQEVRRVANAKVIDLKPGKPQS